MSGKLSVRLGTGKVAWIGLRRAATMRELGIITVHLGRAPIIRAALFTSASSKTMK